MAENADYSPLPTGPSGHPFDQVISGINTDVKVGDIVYHVQTEDKGLKSRLLLSLVYDKGTILASKRVSYDDVLNGDFDEKKLADHLNRQHQLICAALSAGRIEQLKAMTGKARAGATKTASTAARKGTDPVPADTAAAPTPKRSRRAPITQELVLEAVEIVPDDELILGADAVAVVTEMPKADHASNNKIHIDLMGETKFKGGDKKTLTVRVSRGTQRVVVPSAEVMVKVLGSTFRPVLFHGRSDSEGLSKFHLQLPKFETGRAAVLVRVIVAGQEHELRRAVTPG